MTINKSLLVNLTNNSDSKTEMISDVKIRELEEQTQQLQESIDMLSKQMELMAGFESSLIKAFEAEIGLLQEVVSLTPNTTQKQVAKDTALILNRIQKRWCEQASYFIDREKMSIEKT